jgi:hypothetical protein
MQRLEWWLDPVPTKIYIPTRNPRPVDIVSSLDLGENVLVWTMPIWDETRYRNLIDRVGREGEGESI